MDDSTSVFNLSQKDSTFQGKVRANTYIFHQVEQPQIEWEYGAEYRKCKHNPSGARYG